MAKLILQRVQEYQNVKKSENHKIEGSTLGKLSLIDDNGNEIWSGFTCENAGPSTDASGTDKRITPGEYYLEWCVTGKNNGLIKRFSQWKNVDGSARGIWVKRKGDKNFDNRLIRIHIGNYPQDTEGCILPGTTMGNGMVGNSAVATNELYTKIKEMDINSIVMIIKEIE